MGIVVAVFVVVSVVVATAFIMIDRDRVWYLADAPIGEEKYEYPLNQALNVARTM